MISRSHDLTISPLGPGAWPTSLPNGGALAIQGSGHAWFARSASVGLPALATSRGLATFREAERHLRARSATIGKRPVRVPSDAFVQVGPRLLAGPDRTRLLAGPKPDAQPPVTANDNGAPDRDGSRFPPVLRELIFLGIFVATLALTFYLGRMNAFQNVIVIPDTWSRTSALA